jgi:hypothetical protein
MNIGKFNSSKILNNMFRRVGDSVIDLLSGKVGVQTTNGILSLEITPGTPAIPSTATTPAVEATEETYAVVRNLFDQLATPVPAFATPVPLDKVKVGDLIVGATENLGWVIKVRGASLRLLDQKGNQKDHTPIKVQMIGSGAPTVMVVQNLFGTAGFGDVQGALLPLLMMGGDNINTESLMQFAMFSQMAGTTGSLASSLPLLMMMSSKGGANGGIDPMMMLLMSQGGLTGGAATPGGINPLMLMMLQGGLGGNDSSTAKTSGTPALQRISRQY